MFIYIHTQGRYTEKDAATVLRQLFTGLAYMHEKKIVHCDLKPENFLFLSGNDDSPIKIIDFGFSKYTKRRQYHNSFCGTAFYVAPEVLNGSYRESCDLWSLGVITFIMLTGYPPFFSHSGNDKDIFRAIKKGFTNEVRKGFHAGCFSEASKLSESCRDFISKLLVLAPEKRLTANEALSHPWLTGEKASGEPISAVLSKLGSFTARCRLKKAFLVSMTNVVCDDELKALRTSFSEIDVNGDGTLSLSEIASVVSKKGECKLSMSLAAAIDQVDMDHDGTLDYSEILLVAVERKVIAKEERMLAEFHKIDTNHDNRLSVREIMQVVEDADTETVKKMIAEVDTNGDGYIDYDEFLTIFLGAE